MIFCVQALLMLRLSDLEKAHDSHDNKFEYTFYERLFLSSKTVEGRYPDEPRLANVHMPRRLVITHNGAQHAEVIVLKTLGIDCICLISQLREASVQPTIRGCLLASNHWLEKTPTSRSNGKGAQLAYARIKYSYQFTLLQISVKEAI
jgi:hypothetical protein